MATSRRDQTGIGLGYYHTNYICNFKENVPGLAANNHTKYTMQDLDEIRRNVFASEGPRKEDKGFKL